MAKVLWVLFCFENLFMYCTRFYGIYINYQITGYTKIIIFFNLKVEQLAQGRFDISKLSYCIFVCCNITLNYK